jgi:hypothetical protein
MSKDKSGIRALNAKYTKHSEALELISDGATNVTLLVTGHESEEAVAWTVEALEWFKQGRIPQICMFWEISPSTLETAISSNLKDTGKRLLRIVFESGAKLRGSKLTGPEYVHKYCKGVIPGVYSKKDKEITWFEQ